MSSVDDPAQGSVSFDDVRDAERRLAGQVEQTPFLHSRTLSEIAGAQLYLKFENLQFTASFKERGALNKLLQLTPAQLARGVLAVSAGNHAQGVAWHAKRLGAPATIVMPSGTPSVKIARTRALGASIVLHGDRFDETHARGAQIAAERELTTIDPFDDAAVIAGQGTVGLEIARSTHETRRRGRADRRRRPGRRHRHRAAATAPVGARRRRAKRALRARARRAVRRRASVGAATIADGIAVNRLGSITLPLLRRHLDGVLLVDDAQIEQAILLLLEIEKTVVEGAGAAGLAAVLAHPQRFRGRRVGLVLTGGNIDPLLLAAIVERGARTFGPPGEADRRRARCAPARWRASTALLAEERANIEQIHHERAFGTKGAQRVAVEIVVQTESKSTSNAAAALARGGVSTPQRVAATKRAQRPHSARTTIRGSPANRIRSNGNRHRGHHRAGTMGSGIAQRARRRESRDDAGHRRCGHGARREGDHGLARSPREKERSTRRRKPGCSAGCEPPLAPTISARAT